MRMSWGKGAPSDRLWPENPPAGGHDLKLLEWLMPGPALRYTLYSNEARDDRNEICTCPHEISRYGYSISSGPSGMKCFWNGRLCPLPVNWWMGANCYRYLFQVVDSALK